MGSKELGTGLEAVAAGSALASSLRYSSVLQIEPSERGRYYGKSARLAACYAGFAQEFSLGQAWGAGKAAFLSAGYDVVTDWKGHANLQDRYLDIVRQETTPDLHEMAAGLMDRDIKGLLRYDGLERGIVATRFILEMMGLQDRFEKLTDVDRLGINLQVVDDVLDYEEDIQAGDYNFLVYPERRGKYLDEFNVDLDPAQVNRLFPYGNVLKIAINRARNKAANMLENPQKYFQ